MQPGAPGPRRGAASSRPLRCPCPPGPRAPPAPRTPPTASAAAAAPAPAGARAGSAVAGGGPGGGPGGRRGARGSSATPRSLRGSQPSSLSRLGALRREGGRQGLNRRAYGRSARSGAHIREGRWGCLAQDAWRSLAATPGFSRAARRGAAPARVFRSGAPSQGRAAEAGVGRARGRRPGRGSRAAPCRILGCGAPAACALLASLRVPGLGRCGAPGSGVSRVSPARARAHPRRWLHRSKGGRGHSAARVRWDRSRAPPPLCCASSTAGKEGAGVTASSLFLPASSFQTSSVSTEAAARKT